MRSSAQLPPFRVIAAALRVTTERLVREVAVPRDAPPDWTDFEWTIARAVCAMQGISGLLASRLRWRGPASWHEFLEIERAATIARDVQIGNLLVRLDSAFKDAGIAIIPLKGSAVRELRVHQPGHRPQSDIDLLLDPADRAACGPVFETLGYQHLYSMRRHDVYGPAESSDSRGRVEPPDNPLKIEVHSQIAEALPIEPLEITASIVSARRSPGANHYASFAALMRHMCLHAAGNMRANAMRFLQIYEVAELARRMTPVDWNELLGEETTRMTAWWLYPPLILAERYVPGSIPANWLAELRCICPRRLRERFERISIYEVSWSNLRIAALPGREWSRTLGDTLRFARSRAWPSRVALDELSAGLVAAPRIAEMRWYGAPHIERIARWLFSRPPRVQTISAVRAALRADPAP